MDKLCSLCLHMMLDRKEDFFVLFIVLCYRNHNEFVFKKGFCFCIFLCMLSNVTTFECFARYVYKILSCYNFNKNEWQ